MKFIVEKETLMELQKYQANIVWKFIFIDGELIEILTYCAN